MIRVGKNAISCGKKVENWRKNKMHDWAEFEQALRHFGKHMKLYTTSYPTRMISYVYEMCMRLDMKFQMKCVYDFIYTHSILYHVLDL